MTSFFIPSGDTIRFIKRSQLRQFIRGYLKLRQSNKLSLIADIKTKLTETSLGTEKLALSNGIFRINGSQREIAVRQYLLHRYGGIYLNRVILKAVSRPAGRVIFPLPKVWRSILEESGVPVNNFFSEILWVASVSALLLFGILKGLTIVVSGIASMIIGGADITSYAYFYGLGRNNIPSRSTSEGSQNIVSWYLNWPGRTRDVLQIRHSAHDTLQEASIGEVKIKYQKFMLPKLNGYRAIFSYFIWLVKASLFSLVYLIRGNWWGALMLHEAVLAEQVYQSSKESLAREYLFHNSSWIYRPLWTYDAENKGCRVLFYFYSTNCDSFRISGQELPIHYGYKAMSWPCYLVWDKYQESFIRRAAGGDPEINIVGPISFDGSGEVSSLELKNCIAVFDITPFRFSRYSVLGEGFEYYIPKFANMFIEQVGEVIEGENLIMAWKQKRDIGRQAHPSYRRFSDNFLKHKFVLSIPPEVGAGELIKSCAAVISRPFTSTAIIAKSLGIPSVYYDPTGLLSANDRAAHGVELISGIENLKKWLENI